MQYFIYVDLFILSKCNFVKFIYLFSNCFWPTQSYSVSNYLKNLLKLFLYLNVIIHFFCCVKYIMFCRLTHVVTNGIICLFKRWNYTISYVFLIYWWTHKHIHWFHLVPIVNISGMNTEIQVSLWKAYFNYSVHLFNREILDSSSSSIFIF